MTTSVESDTQGNRHKTFSSGSAANLARRLVSNAFARELLLVLAFCLLTSVMTWPYVTRMRDAVAGPGDPYLITWTMWWDYHQTFTDPLRLFQSNTFYPYKYTLAFSETCYGLALIFFPLFAIGLKPLTVHSVGMFLGFALSGYGAFRLMRTLTGSSKAAWVSGILFAFIPYRFNLMAQLMYLFSAWIPLLFEALVLFVRVRSWKRAAWLGVAFLMTGLTTITWLLMSLIPLALVGVLLLTRYKCWTDRKFWLRSAATVGAAAVCLVPFTIPFYLVSKIYGFKRSIEDVRSHSAMPIHWVVAEGRSKVWHRMGEAVQDGWKFQMFPGLFALLFPFAEFLFATPAPYALGYAEKVKARLTKSLDVLAVLLFPLTLISLGFTNSYSPVSVYFRYLPPERVLMVLVLVVVVRMCIAFPRFFRQSESANLIKTLHTRDDAFWISLVLIVIGFFYSLGWNFILYRVLYDFMPGFKSIRAPMRGAMFAYLGLSILAGLGVKRIAELVVSKRPRIREGIVYALCCLLLLLELNGAPLYFIRGAVNPDAVTLRLKETSMHGGITYFPANREVNQRYMLRAADHAKPLILGTSGFSPPYVDQIEQMTAAGKIPIELMDLLEKIPASYLVVANGLIDDQRKADYEYFLGRVVAAGRLRFINRFDDSNDLYAVTKTEPSARSEAPLPPGLSIRDWANKVHGDQMAIMEQPRTWGQRLYRLYVASYGAMPRYKDFVSDLERLGRGVVVGSEEQEARFAENFDQFVQEWMKRSDFLKGASNDNEHFVDQLLRNSGVRIEPEARLQLIRDLSNGGKSRAALLTMIVDDPQFINKEEFPSLVVLHYFAYLGRNPDDPPDGDLRGFNFWVGDLERNHDPSKIAVAFQKSGEYLRLQEKHDAERQR